MVLSLHRMGLTPRKLTRRSFQRDDEARPSPATETFPAFVRGGRRRQLTLLFGVEAGANEDAPVGPTPGSKGDRPFMRRWGWRRQMNVISAVSPRGRLWFRCFNGTPSATVLVGFLGALIQDVRGRIVLVLDRRPAQTVQRRDDGSRHMSARSWRTSLPPMRPR
ncbi:hypothetical protein FBQ97_15680 [Acidobacteria bacterium ACD]|nr:hypothetical protein [Acidobacteria bacterium ACD]